MAATTTFACQFILLAILRTSIKADNGATHILDQVNQMACDRHKLYTSIMHKGHRIQEMTSSAFHQQATIPFEESMRRSELAKVIEDLVIVLADKINSTTREFIDAHRNVNVRRFYHKYKSSVSSTEICSSKNENSLVPFPFSPRNWAQLTNKCRQLMDTFCPFTPSKYRNIDGTCNNLIRPQWGSTNTCLLRLLPTNYGNGFNSPRLSITNKPLPNPRLVSTSLRQEDPPSDPNINHLFMAFGQFVAHDLASVPTEFLRTNTKLEKIMCCDTNFQHDACLPIDVTKDGFYSFQNVTCLNFVRSAPCPTCLIGAREQSNKLTAYLDASQVYGISEKDSKKIRSFSKGRLRVSHKSLLPDGLMCNPNIRRKCFLAGDTRANENLPLTAMHTLFMREHNRIADQLAEMHPMWTDRVLFEETKRIVTAELQVIVYNEYLSTLFGVNYTRERGLNLNKDAGLLSEYNPDVQVGIFNVFTTNAFRFGHSTIQDNLLVINGSCRYNLAINNVMFNSFLLHNNYGMDSIIAGLLQQKQNKADEALTGGMADNMFAFTAHMTGLDLAAINILRARERGIPSYNAWRSFCSLNPFTSFEHMNGSMPTRVWTVFKQLYSDVDDVDLFPAGLAEFKTRGSLVGPTFGCILAHQFSSLRRGDRFFLEVGHQPSSFTHEQVLTLKKSTLSRIICDNSDGRAVDIQPDAFRVPNSADNPVVPCSVLPSVDLGEWSDEMSENRTASPPRTMGDLQEISCRSTTNQSSFYFTQPQTVRLSPQELKCDVQVELNSRVCALNINSEHIDPNQHKILSVFDPKGNELMSSSSFNVINSKIAISNKTYVVLSLWNFKPSFSTFFYPITWKIQVQQVTC